MLDLKLIRENLEVVEKALAHRNYDFDLSRILTLDKEFRSDNAQAESIRAQRNEVAGNIARAKRNGEDVTQLVTLGSELGDRLAKIEGVLQEKEKALFDMLHVIPNIPHETVPVGPNENHNVVIKQWGDVRRFGFKPQAHWDIGPALDILDMERGAKIAGSRFPLLKGAGAKLERALIDFMIDIHVKEQGYTEIFPPFIVHAKSAFGTGQLPKFKEDMFKIENQDMYLIPTAEVPVTNMFRDEILPADTLPIKYTAYSGCFRSESMSAGKDTRGIIRNHQFNKVELVHFVTPETSYDHLELLTEDAEAILETLELPYRRVALCTGDLGFASSKTYDLEVWLPSYHDYKEISSCSNFLDFQARRANLRFRRQPKSKPEFLHTLNGSGVAVGRCWAAIIENYQNEDGTVTIPKALVPYMDGMKVIGR